MQRPANYAPVWVRLRQRTATPEERATDTRAVVEWDIPADVPREAMRIMGTYHDRREGPTRGDLLVPMALIYVDPQYVRRFARAVPATKVPLEARLFYSLVWDGPERQQPVMCAQDNFRTHVRHVLRTDTARRPLTARHKAAYARLAKQLMERGLPWADANAILDEHNLDAADADGQVDLELVD